MTQHSETGDALSAAEPSVVFLSGDLMFASRVRGAAEAAGLEFQLAGSLPNRPGIRWVIVDLATRAGVLETLMQRAGECCPDARVIAFGPHVQTARLDQARRAGVPQVVTRGQFDRALATLFHD